MLGGLITERDTMNKAGLPFLVRVPVLKHLFGSTNTTKERRELMIFVQPRILEDESEHLLEQARMGDHIAQFDKAAQFGGMPEEVVPRAQPAGSRPNHLLPPAGNTVETKKTFFSKVKSMFGHKQTAQP